MNSGPSLLVSNLLAAKHIPTSSILQDFQNQPSNNEIIATVLRSLELPIQECLIQELKNGHVHYVFVVSHSSIPQGFIIKVRRDHFSSRPNIRISPLDIAYEWCALEHLGKHARVTPEVLWKDYNIGTLVMTNVWASHISIQEIIESWELTIPIVSCIWRGIWTLHTQLNTIGTIRNPSREEEFYKNNLYYRFWLLNIDELDLFMFDLYSKDKFPIHGDLSPRNIFYNPELEQVSFIDFETVHYWNSEFDSAFFKAHLLLLNWSNWLEFEKLCLAFDDGYKTTSLDRSLRDSQIEIKLILSTLLYRTWSDFKFWSEYRLPIDIIKTFALEWLKKNIRNYNDLKHLRLWFPL